MIVMNLFNEALACLEVNINNRSALDMTVKLFNYLFRLFLQNFIFTEIKF